MDRRIRMSVLVVGAGGTGGYVIKEFARYMASVKDGPVEIRLGICDGDIVERKNLDRQSFQEEDIGENKAVVLAGAIKECIGLRHVYAYPKYIDGQEDISAIFKGLVDDTRYEYPKPEEYRVIVGCVDNHRARQAMEDYYRSVRRICYIDSANEFKSGEVVVSYRLDKVYGKPRSFYFPDVKKDTGKKASEMSCTELNQAAPQHILTNMLAGQISLASLIGFVSEGNVSPGIHYFNAFTGEAVFRPYQDEAKKKEGGDGVHKG